MSVKCKGIDFKAWMESDWGGKPGDDPYWDDVWVMIDGEGTDDPDPSKIADTANVVIETGHIFFSQTDADCKTASAVTHYKRWAKEKDTETFILRVTKNRVAEVKALLSDMHGVNFV